MPNEEETWNMKRCIELGRIRWKKCVARYSRTINNDVTDQITLVSFCCFSFYIYIHILLNYTTQIQTEVNFIQIF